ncbi:hypothetical protein [Saccharicrinis sp. FJH54]|uniref:hypothetical protein n=1 Tax=Saccharicrinis sp. FJH54 TaxID=3344665 RepID=UPI0035D4985E
MDPIRSDGAVSTPVKTSTDNVTQAESKPLVNQEKSKSAAAEVIKQPTKKVKSVTGLGSIGISIKGNNAQDQNEEAVSTDGSREKNKQKFTEQALLQEWRNMIAEIAEDKVHLAETLKSHQPELAADAVTIKLTVHNNIQEKRIIEEQSLILDHLRSKLKNDLIRFSITVDETVEEKKFFTNSEKLQRMISKNPDINLLRKMFDLDLE